MKNTMRVGLVAALALGLAGLGASAASAVDTIPADSYFQGTIYLASAADGTNWTTTPTAFLDQVIAEPAPGDAATKFAIPAGATGAFTFVSPVGSESTPAAWNAKAVLGLTAGGIWLPNVSLTNQTVQGGGTPNGINAVAAAGGNYSLGVAFTTANGLTVVSQGLYYAHITVTAGTGAFTITQVTNGSAPTPTPTPTATPAGSATQGLAAQVTVPAVVDGLLSLTAPASTTSTIGNATIVNGSSTSTGALGNFQVQDGRAASKPGWTLTTSNVADFVNGATTIGKKNLGFAPKNVSGVAATLGAAQVAGAAVYPSLFAEMAAGTAGTSTLDADLTFVAPAGSPSGTYTSTLTVTLVSK